MKILTELIDTFITFINTTLVPLVFAIAFIVFLYGVYRFFILGGDNDEKRAEGRQYIMYGVIGFAVMVSVWGLVNLLVNTFGFNSQARPCLPTFSGGCTSGTGSTNTNTPAPVTSQPTNILPPGYDQTPVKAGTVYPVDTNTQDGPAHADQGF